MGLRLAKILVGHVVHHLRVYRFGILVSLVPVDWKCIIRLHHSLLLGCFVPILAEMLWVSTLLVPVRSLAWTETRSRLFHSLAEIANQCSKKESRFVIYGHVPRFGSAIRRLFFDLLFAHSPQPH